MAVRTFRLSGSKIMELAVPASGLDEVSLQLPRGAYTTFRTYERLKVLGLDLHLDRLCESAALEGVSVTLDAQLIRRALATALRLCDLAESRLRITLTYDAPEELLISLEPFKSIDPGLYSAGAHCSLALPNLRRHNPRAKSTAFIAPASKARSLQADKNEVLLVDDNGAILEGSSSNFFGIIAGVLYTADTGVLAGTTRSMILSVARELLPVRLEPILVENLSLLDESFISSVSRGVLPVVNIDNMPVGNGMPGPFTQAIGQGFNSHLERILEDLSAVPGV